MTILRSPEWTVEERSLEKLATFVGVPVRDLQDPIDDGASVDTPAHVAATCQSLGAFARRPSGKEWLSRKLAVEGSSLFLTGISPVDDVSGTIAQVLPGVVDSVTSLGADATTLNVASDVPAEIAHFAELAIGPVDVVADSAFVLLQAATGVTEIVTVGGRPCYFMVERRSALYFMVACASVLDIDEPALPTQQVLGRFLQFVPFVSYLRRMFGTLCWHNERPAACVIIDDPLLTSRYGFLTFSRLETWMKRSRFSTNIAFIPWNCRRSDPEVAQMFTRSDRQLSISVHGCDHTEAEFGITDRRRLRIRTRRALARMDVHERLTGIKHNRVMVFPQGVFSKASLRALGDEGFLAAVNSTPYSVDATPGDITFRDLLSVAVLTYGGAPLFIRHYPNRPAEFALDLFLGRPLLMVEHHSFFKDGYEAIGRHAAFVNRIAPHIRWTDLEDLCASATLRQDAPADGVHIHAYGPLVHLRNDSPGAKVFRVRNLWAQDGIESVEWKGQAADFEVLASGTVCTIELASAVDGDLIFRRRSENFDEENDRPAMADRVKAFARRHLSEFRDNYLAKSDVLNHLARAAKHVLPRM